MVHLRLRFFSHYENLLLATWPWNAIASYVCHKKSVYLIRPVYSLPLLNYKRRYHAEIDTHTHTHTRTHIRWPRGLYTLFTVQVLGMWEQYRAAARIFVRRFDLPSSSLSLPSPSFPSPPLPFHSHSFPPYPTRESGERCKLPQQCPGWSLGRKHMLTHLRLSKHISWQHLSVVYVQCRHLHDGSSRYVFVDLSREKILNISGSLNPLTSSP